MRSLAETLPLSLRPDGEAPRLLQRSDRGPMDRLQTGYMLYELEMEGIELTNFSRNSVEPHREDMDGLKRQHD
jgi:hypothetical protein